MAVAGLLPYLVMLEPQGTDRAIVRVFGTALVRRLGFDLTGEDLIAIYEEPRRTNVSRLIATMLREKTVVVTFTEWMTPSGHSFETENLWLPLVDDSGRVNRIMISVREPVAPPACVDPIGDGVSSGSLTVSPERYYRL